MAWTDADEARYQQLGQQLGYIPAPAPQPASPSALGRIGEGLANAPSNVAQGLINGAIGVSNIGQPQGYAIPQVNVPKPYDIPSPQTFGQRAADLITGLLSTVATAAIPGGIATKGLSLLGAGAGTAAVVGDIAGGGLLGFGQSPREAAQTGAEFGAQGLLMRAPVPGYVKALGNLAIPLAGQLMRGQDPTSQESLLNDAANVGVPWALGHYADSLARPPAPLLTPAQPSSAPPILQDLQSQVLFSRLNEARNADFQGPVYTPHTEAQLIQGLQVKSRANEARNADFIGPVTDSPPEIQSFSAFTTPEDQRTLEASNGTITAPIDPSLTGYHGTPHTLDPEEGFNFSKMGTGQGDQAFGYGAYIAQEPKVADTYSAAFDGTPGNKYTVQINRPDEHFVDWSEPLSGQSDHVKAAVSALGYEDLLDNGSKGADLYDHLLLDSDPKGASTAMSEAGLAGFRYPDNFSKFRPKDQRTSNFVVFDPKDIKVTHANGQEVGIRDALDASIAEKQEDAHHDEVEQAIRQAASAYPSRENKVQVHEGLDSPTVPSEFRDRALKNPANAYAEGLNDPSTGTQHFFTRNIGSSDRAREVAVHEIVGHYGVDQIIHPEAWQGIQDHVMNNGGAMRDSIADTYRDHPDLPNRITREYVARVAENTSLDPTLWQKVTAAVRSALRAAGIRREWSDAEIQDLVRSAHRNLKKSSPQEATLTRGGFARPPEAQSGRTGMDAARYRAATPEEQREHQLLQRRHEASPELLTSTQKARMELLGRRMPAKEDSGASIEPRVQEAYKSLVARSGWPAVHVSDLAKESGAPLEEVKSLLGRAHQQGKAHLSLGDTSVVSPEVRAGAIDTAAQKGNLLVRLTGKIDPSQSEEHTMQRDMQSNRGLFERKGGWDQFQNEIEKYADQRVSDRLEGKAAVAKLLSQDFSMNGEVVFPARTSLTPESRIEIGMLYREALRRGMDVPDSPGLRRYIGQERPSIGDRIDPSLPRRMDEAAEESERGRGGLLGKLSRQAEIQLGLSATPESKLATQKGEGLEQLLTKRVNDKSVALQKADQAAQKKGVPLLTPADKDALHEFQTSKGTPSDVAALKSAGVPKVAEEFATTHKEAQLAAGENRAQAEGGKRAVAIQKNETYTRRAYELLSNPALYAKKFARGDYDAKLDDVVNLWKTKPEFSALDISTIKLHWEQYLKDLRDGKPFQQGSGSEKISQSLYTAKKDLTYDQWQTMEGLQKDARLNPAQQALVKDAVKAEHLTPTIRGELDKLSNDSRFTKDERSTLADISTQETVPPEVRAVLGEYTDPVERIAFTTAKSLRSIKQTETLNQIADSTLKSGIPLTFKDTKAMESALKSATPEQRKDLTRYKELPDEDGFGKLAGRWAHVSVRDALNDINQGMESGADGFWGKVQKVLKLNATVLNPSTHAHWWMQMPLMFAMARVYNPADWLKAGKIVLNEEHPLHDELIRNNIIGAGSQRDLNLNAQKISTPASELNQWDKIKTGGDKALQFLGKLYGRPDDIIRTAAYLKAKSDALKSGMPEQEAQNAAITYTNRYTFNYGTTPRLTKWASNVPGLNPFLSYSSELTRITKNLAEDVISGSPGDRVHGALNLALMAAVPLAASLGSSAANLSAKDQQDWDRIRKLEDPEKRGAIKYVLNRDQKTGKFNFVDVSPVIPAGDTFSMARDILRGDWKAFAADQPAIGLSHSPIASLGIDLATRTNNNTGQRMFTAEDYASRIANAALPPLLGSQLQRDLRSFTPNNDGGLGLTNPRTGRVDTPVTSLLGHVGVRLQSEMLGSLMASASSDAQAQRDSARQQANQLLRTNADQATRQAVATRYQQRLLEINREFQDRVRQ